LLSVKRDSQEDLQSLYELLVKVTNNPTTVQALIKCENYDEFVKIVLDERHA
jgi:lichenan operon transcriptional antiterminator